MKRIFHVDVYLAEETEYTLVMLLLSIRKENHYNALKCPWNVLSEYSPSGNFLQT